MKTIVLPSRPSRELRPDVERYAGVTAIDRPRTVIDPQFIGFCLLFLLAATAAFASLR